jgi:hypothetical protein
VEQYRTSVSFFSLSFGDLGLGKYCILSLLLTCVRVAIVAAGRSIDRSDSDATVTMDLLGVAVRGVGVAIMAFTNDRCLGRCCGSGGLLVSDR